jgi:uncharacterized protein YndB with AHSA1/START domain
MPREKDLKRLVRARMQKTGEAYTAARAQLLKKSNVRPSAAAAPAVQPVDYAALAGMSDDAVKAKTGCTWERWVRSLDYYGAAELSHRELAELIRTKYNTPSWWTQTVAVGYERIKGLRTRGQSRAGTFAATKSRTFDVPVEVLFRAWHDARTRRKWLPESGVKIRTATAPKSIRLGWSDGSIIAVGFTSKGDGRSAVALEHGKLPDRDAATRFKAYWAERLAALAGVLTPPAAS